MNFEQAVSNQLCDIKSTLQKSLLIQEANHKVSNDIYFFTIPEAGGDRLFYVGKTSIDFISGIIVNPDGSIEKLNNSLGQHGLQFVHSLSLDANQDCILRIDNNPSRTIYADYSTQIPYLTFSRILLTCTVNTNIQIFACTNPQAVIGQFRNAIGSSMSQETISKDEVEAATNDTLLSLLNNLNRIRYNIAQLSGEVYGTFSHTVSSIWEKFNAITGHNHSGANGGAQIDHTTLSNIGTNTHIQIDDAIAGIFPVVDSQIFTASGTWTKPANINFALITVIGGGGGGGNGNDGTTGGCGGGGGGKMQKFISASLLSATETVTVGASVAAGEDGNPSLFGLIAKAQGGLAGISTSSPGAGGAALFTQRTSNGAFGGAGATNEATTTGLPAEFGGASGALGFNSAGNGYTGGASDHGGGGGGGGGGYYGGAYAGGTGGKSGTNAGGVEGAAGNGTGGTGNAATWGNAGSGGGGGGSGSGAGGGGAGGIGGAGGGGGGGGGCGAISIGGAGGRGEVRIICW